MTREHLGHATHGHGFLAPLLGSAALGAAITYVLLGAQPGNARADLGPPQAALAREVSVQARLVKGERGWSVQLNAISTAAAARRCNIVATLNRIQSNTMSRVLPAPQVVWTGSVTITVPAKGEAPQWLAIPANVAKDIPDPTPRPSPRGTRAHYGVQVQTTCGDNDGDRVS